MTKKDAIMAMLNGKKISRMDYFPQNGGHYIYWDEELNIPLGIMDKMKGGKFILVLKNVYLSNDIEDFSIRIFDVNNEMENDNSWCIVEEG